MGLEKGALSTYQLPLSLSRLTSEKATKVALVLLCLDNVTVYFAAVMVVNLVLLASLPPLSPSKHSAVVSSLDG